MISSQPQKIDEAIYISWMHGYDRVAVHVRLVRLPDADMTVLTQVDLKAVIVIGDIDRAVGSVEWVVAHERPNGWAERRALRRMLHPKSGFQYADVLWP